LYRIRPEGNGTRLIFVESVETVGTRIVNPQIVNPTAIINSNTYYGVLFRKKGLDEESLQKWIKECEANDLLAFAKFLGLSPSDTALLLWDINRTDGSLINDKWHSNLLRFSTIAAPKYGPAAGLESLQDWRNYAGASKIAPYPIAKERARLAHRERPNLDDFFFSFDKLPSPRGWEVHLGNAFN